jgi:hypothetical protein
VNTRFRVDLLHPGAVAGSWEGWLTGPHGARRLAAFAIGGVAALALVLIAGILPAYWQLARDRAAAPGLAAELAARDADLRLLRANLQSLANEARRQVRWGELLTAFSQQIPPDLKLELVETARPTPSPPGAAQAAAGPARAEEALRIAAITPVRAGSPPLLEVSRFLGGLMRDPLMSKRFDVRSWEIKPSSAAIGSAEQYLTLEIVLAERAP